MKSIFTTFFCLLFALYSSAQCWQQVAAGIYHTTAIKSDSTLWEWGRDYMTGLAQNIPLQVGVDRHWLATATGDSHTLAIKSDGSLWGWGGNFRGQLGDETILDHYTPEQVGTDTDWKNVTAGSGHSVALKNDGTLWAWGWNDTGQVGNGTAFEDQLVPVQISTATDWDQLVAGSIHSMAIRNDGTLWGWGGNNYGELGIGSNTYYYNIPVQVGVATDWQQVAAGGEYTLAIKNDGTLWAWGQNHYGQLGIGNYEEPNAPQQVGTDTDWEFVAAKYYTSLAIKSNGTLWAWGRNDAGQLGDGTLIKRIAPVQIGSATNWQKVSAGLSHTLAITNTGTLRAWGQNEVGQLGNGTDSTSITPVEISCPLTSATNAFAGIQFVISPNPVRDYLAIQTTDINTIGLTFEISKMLGKIVYANQQLNENQEINVEHLVPGIYVLFIGNKDRQMIKQFVKM